MNWTRSETLALAQQSCTICFGLGLRESRAETTAPCNCVFRAIFRACYMRFKKCVSTEGRIGRVSLESNPGKQRKSVWHMRNEEYAADFVLVSRRVLGANTAAWRLFKFHFLLGADWKLCCRRLRIERGAFFHEVYRIQQRLGRAYRELQPHSLFPLDEYFGAVVRPSAVPDTALTDTASSGQSRPRTTLGVIRSVSCHERPCGSVLPLERCSLRAPLRAAKGGYGDGAVS